MFLYLYTQHKQWTLDLMHKPTSDLYAAVWKWKNEKCEMQRWSATLYLALFGLHIRQEMMNNYFLSWLTRGYRRMWYPPSFFEISPEVGLQTCMGPKKSVPRPVWDNTITVGFSFQIQTLQESVPEHIFLMCTPTSTTLLLTDK